MSRRIVVVTDNAPDQINGVVTTFRNIEQCAHLDGYQIEYIDPRLFSSRPAPGYPEVRLCWPRGLSRHLADLDPDHVHICTEGPLGVAARLCMDRWGWRYNTSYHTRFPEFLNSIYGVPTGVTYAYLRWFHKHSGRVLTTTDTMADELRQRGFSGELVSWTRGVDRAALAPTQDWPHPNQPLRVLVVSRISREKNLDALCRLNEQFDIHVVGDGPYRHELETKFPTVKFWGYQQGRALADHYARADVFAFPSQNDTFGIVMIEAMSVGTPVAAFPVPGPMDVVSVGVNGALSMDLAQAIQQARDLDRARVRASSQRWTWQACWDIFRDNLIER